MYLIRAPVSNSSKDFVKKRVKLDVLNEIEVLDESQKDPEKFNARSYKAQTKKVKDDIRDSIRRRLIRETSRARILGSKETKKIRWRSSYKD